MENIVLIGVPGAGKSTMGVILAKALGRTFIDTDLVIQERKGMLLQEIIEREGKDAFLKAEEEAILSLRCRNAVIATGGSVIFSRKAMEHLKSHGIVVYLKISCAEMERRLKNIKERGIVLQDGEGLREMYTERVPLYEKYADIIADCTDTDFENCVHYIIQQMRNRTESCL